MIERLQLIRAGFYWDYDALDRLAIFTTALFHPIREVRRYLADHEQMLKRVY